MTRLVSYVSSSLTGVADPVRLVNHLASSSLDSKQTAQVKGVLDYYEPAFCLFRRQSLWMI
jgi:hypothetical protein